MKSFLADLAKYGGGLITVLEIVENFSGVPGSAQVWIGLVVAVVTGAVTWAQNQKLAAAKAAAKAAASGK